MKSPLSELADGFVKITGYNKGPRSADGNGASTHGTPVLIPRSLLRKSWLEGDSNLLQYTLLIADKEKKGEKKIQAFDLHKEMLCINSLCVFNVYGYLRD